MKVKEFSRKFLEPEWSDRHQQYVTTGYDKEIGFETQSVPQEIKNAVDNNELRINDNYGPSQGEISLVAKELENYSVLVVANKLMDNYERPLVGHRYFWIEKNESLPEIDGIKTLLNWWEEKEQPQLELKPNLERDKELKQRQQSDYYDAQPLMYQKSRLKINAKDDKEPLVIKNPATIEEVHSVSLQLKNARPRELIAWAWNARKLEKPNSFTVISPLGLTTEKILTPPTIQELKKKDTEVSRENTPTTELKVGDKVKLGYVPGAVNNLQTGMEVTVNAPSYLRGNQEMIELKREDDSTFLWPVENLEKVEIIESEVMPETPENLSRWGKLIKDLEDSNQEEIKHSAKVFGTAAKLSQTAKKAINLAEESNQSNQESMEEKRNQPKQNRGDKVRQQLGLKPDSEIHEFAMFVTQTAINRGLKQQDITAKFIKEQVDTWNVNPQPVDLSDSKNKFAVTVTQEEAEQIPIEKLDASLAKKGYSQEEIGQFNHREKFSVFSCIRSKNSSKLFPVVYEDVKSIPNIDFKYLEEIDLRYLHKQTENSLTNSEESQSSVSTEDGKKGKKETEVKPLSEPKNSSSKTSTNQEKETTNNKVEDKMLNDSAKPEIKATGDNVQEIQSKTILLAAQLTQLLFDKLKDNPSLRKDLKIKLDEPANVNIYVGDELKYQSREGANPEVNQLKQEQLELIQKALQMKVGDSINSKSNITITINDQPILEVKNGVIEKNDLQSELVGQLSPEQSQKQELKNNKHSTVESSNSQNKSKKLEKKNKTSQKLENNHNNRQPKEIPIEFPDESKEKETISKEPKEIKIEFPDESKKKETISKEPKEIPIEIADESKEKTNKKEEQKTRLEVTDEPKKTKENSQRNPKKVSHQLDAETLKQQGVDPKLVRDTLEQIPNKNSPVIIIVNNNQDKNKLAKATKNAPTNTKVGLLQKVKDFVKNKTPEPISKAVNSVIRPFRNERARQQDLKSLNTLVTSKQLLQEFGSQNKENKSFSTGNYQFRQEKDATVSLVDAQRGVLFNYDGKTGSITKNNLEKGDMKALDQMKKELNQYQQNKNGRQQERNQEKEVVEIG